MIDYFLLIFRILVFPGFTFLLLLTLFCDWMERKIEARLQNRVEAPRGELFYYVRSNGTDMPDRVKVRTPTFANIPSFLKTAIGESIADVPANFVSLDPCFSCTDR
jgi:Ni,Fe-hydrogenase III large subunit